MLTVELEIARRAEKFNSEALTNLHHLVDVELLREVFGKMKKRSSPGVDGQDWYNYCIETQEDMHQLLEEFKSGSYRAPQVRRVYIPKDKYSKRPIGIPTIRDKILQGGVRSILEPIYEKEFKNFSYGFRQGKSMHQALDYLSQQINDKWITHIIDADMENFFGSMDHGNMREFLARRVNDGKVRKTIDKWMKAGVLEEGETFYPETGTPQGGAISPLLSNIYLHEVLDKWFEEVIQPLLKGRSFIVRFADDFVMGFSEEEDARRVMAVLPKRLAKFKLKLHLEKTRIVQLRPETGEGRGTFDFLGFTHYMGKSRKGKTILKRKTSKKKFTKAVKQITAWVKENRNLKLKEMINGINVRLRGHYNYYGITHNSKGISRFYDVVSRILHKWINRRGGKKNKWNWSKFHEMIKKWSILLKPKIYHVYANPFPEEPYAGKPLVRVCGGAGKQ